LGPNFASVAKKILLSTAAFVLWKSAILCAFLGRFWAFSMWNSGQSLRAAGLLSSAGVERATLNKKNFPSNNGFRKCDEGRLGLPFFISVPPCLGRSRAISSGGAPASARGCRRFSRQHRLRPRRYLGELCKPSVCLGIPRPRTLSRAYPV
jgi:hypothetical protein